MIWESDKYTETKSDVINISKVYVNDRLKSLWALNVLLLV